eukprot:TRINITY_DN46762_c0_g1_i1.p1 TRINITY_DN46762_c0_g1~~TRINITY_DN46762_c0_g1_i1.p1  ORF type:complete len:461 (+),score=59.81 TRINITY_DN46762_c0_g1_i1:34-1416(+)
MRRVDAILLACLACDTRSQAASEHSESCIATSRTPSQAACHNSTEFDDVAALQRGITPAFAHRCLPSQGVDKPLNGYKYVVTDSKACSCSEWNVEKNAALGASWQHCSKHHIIPGAPWGLVFFGMSLSQRFPDVPTANHASVTHQTKFDLNRLQDRANEYLCKTSDDGWLAGGGNGPSSFLLPNIDSAHMEFVHPGSLCDTLSECSEVKPNVKGYRRAPKHITGAPLASLIARVQNNLSFDPIRVVPTQGKFTGTDEYQLRFDPLYANSNVNANPTMTNVYNGLVNLFSDIQVLDKSDPFHVSMCRETKFCSNRSRNQFFDRNTKLTIEPWRKWAADSAKQGGAQGTLLNDEIARYADKAGGFYLFVTRNRPLIYFAPRSSGKRSNGSRAYYCEWRQDGRVIDFANPFGGPVDETLLIIPDGEQLHEFIESHGTLKRMSTQLCSKYAYKSMPTSEWTPPS